MVKIRDLFVQRGRLKLQLCSITHSLHKIGLGQILAHLVEIVMQAG